MLSGFKYTESKHLKYIIEETKQPSGILILLQYIVNKARGGAKRKRIYAIGCSSLPIIQKENVWLYSCSHGFKKKHLHTHT